MNGRCAPCGMASGEGAEQIDRDLLAHREGPEESAVAIASPDAAALYDPGRVKVVPWVLAFVPIIGCGIWYLLTEIHTAWWLAQTVAVVPLALLIVTRFKRSGTSTDLIEDGSGPWTPP